MRPRRRQPRQALGPPRAGRFNRLPQHVGQVLDEPEYSADEPNHDECEGNLDEQADQEHRDERGRGLRRRPAARRFDERVCGEAEHRDETKQPERPARPSCPVLPERDSGRDCGREGEAERQ